MAKLQRETDVANVLSQMSQLVQYPHENGGVPAENSALKDASVYNESEESEHAYAQNNTSGLEMLPINTKATSKKVKKRHTCELCGRAFSKLCNLKSHLRVHRGEKPHTCDICSHAFVNVWDLIKHNRTHSGEKPYKCCHCGRRFSAFGSHQRHLRLHTNEKPYTCHVCFKAFSRLDSYKNHVNTHSDKKPFICETCDKKFAYASSYKRHMNSHLGEKKFRCNTCNKSFTRQDCLLNHKRKHKSHEKDEKPDNEKRRCKNANTSLDSVIDINEGELLLCPSTEIESSSSYSVSADLSPIPILLSMAECAVVNGSMCNNTEYLDSASLLAAASEIELGSSTEIPTSHYDVGIDLEDCPMNPESQGQNTDISTHVSCVSESSYSRSRIVDQPDKSSDSDSDDTDTSSLPFSHHDISLLYKIGIQEATRSKNTVIERKKEICSEEDSVTNDFRDKIQNDDDKKGPSEEKPTATENSDLETNGDDSFVDSFESQSFATCVTMPESTVSYSFSF